MFSSEYCEIFKNTCFEEHLRTAVSEPMVTRKSHELYDSRLTNYSLAEMKSFYLSVDQGDAGGDNSSLRQCE